MNPHKYSCASAISTLEGIENKWQLQTLYNNDNYTYKAQISSTKCSSALNTDYIKYGSNYPKTTHGLIKIFCIT